MCLLILDLEAVYIIGQRKVFCRQRISEPSCARKEPADIGIFLTSGIGHRKIMQSIRITSRPTLRIRKRNQFSQFRWIPTNYLQKRLKPDNFRQWAKGWREAASEGPTVLHICFCSLFNNSKKQLEAPAQIWYQYSIQSCVVDL